MVVDNIQIPRKEIEALCTKWGIEALELFGSVTREDFSANSDVDILVTFEPERTPGLFEFLDVKEELERIFRRRVDLLTRKSIEKSRNPFRKKEILRSTQVIYGKRAA